ncbi:MAG: hypothetical protein AAGJ35_15780, partial [Myxococcota bacterium]
MFHTHNIHLPPNASGETKTTCPQCSSTRQKQNEKCLAVHVERGLWYCHHCQWKGSLAESSNLPAQATPSIQTHTLDAHTHIQLRTLNASEEAFWSTYHISSQLLQKYNVHAVEAYSSLSKLKKPYTIRSSHSQPIFAYQVEDPISKQTSFKIYAPHSKIRFRWLGPKPTNYIFGLEQLPTTGSQLIITGGEKDVLT